MRIASWTRLGAAGLMLGILGGNASPAPLGPMLPDRLLICSIGHVINFDPHKEQTPADLRYDGFHEFTLFLSTIAPLTGRPPDAIEDAPPVNPRTRIVSDPDHISGQPNHRFGRIIDLWPERVELSATIAGPLLNAITITPIDPAHGTASLFMLRATELTRFDPAHIYQGSCRVTTGDMARAAVNPRA